MKLFENGIGRPSNEIKKKRKIFIATAIVLCITLVSVFAFALTKIDVDRFVGLGEAYGGQWVDIDFGEPYISDCQFKIPVEFHGKAKKNENVNYKKATLFYQGTNTAIGSQDFYWSLRGKNDYKKTFSFDLGKIDNTQKMKFRLTFYFTITYENGKTTTDYIYEYRNFSFKSEKTMQEAIKKCKSKQMKLSCKTAKVNSEFTCETEKGGVIVVDDKNLASGYDNKGTTSIKLKYTKAGNYKISAVKKGITKTITITVAEADKPNNTKKLTLDCPSSAKTGEWFKCTTNKGLKDVKITADSNGFSGNKIEFTTSSTDNVKDLRYSTAGKKIITATYGKQEVTKTVEVKAASSNTQKPAETKPAETKTASLKSMKISCQDAVANKAFTCTVKDSNNKKLTKAAIKVNTSKDLAKNYKTSSKGSLKLKYTKSKKVELIAKLDGYKTKKLTVNIEKAPTTTTKKQTSTSSSIASYNINYSIPKVTKTGNNGEKKIEFKITNVGKNVKYYKHIICFERDACIGENGDEARYKGMTSLKGAKVGATSSVDIITVNNAALLNQDFYVRVETYDKDKKFIYYKTHHFYVNPTTSSTSKNKNVSDEARVQIDDFAGTTHDFLFSLKSDKVKSTYQVNYGIPSIKKLSELDIDGGVKKSVNIAMHDFGENVKYVSFVVCMKKNYCLRPNVIDYVSQDPYRGSVLPYQIPEHGKEIPIEITTEDEEMLNQKIYVRIYSYDTNKKLLFSKLHEFTTGKATKLGVKKEFEIKVGDRVVSEVTKAIKSEKYK